MQIGTRLESWAVAAAILIVFGGGMHIDELTRMVMKTDLTTLGLRGKSPRQALCPQLLKRPHVFESCGHYSGRYRTTTTAFEDAKVAEALTTYRFWLKSKLKNFDQD